MNAGFFLPAGEAFHHLGDDVAADPVVQRAADQAFVGEFQRPVLIDRRMAHAEAELRDLGGIGGADIDPQVMHGGGLFRSVLVAPEVDRGVADDAGNRALVAENGQPPAAGGRRVGAAHPVEPQEPVFVDVLDHVADLVGMGLQHDDFGRLAGQRGPGRAIGVAFDGGGVLADPLRPDLLARHFKTGGARGFQQSV